MKWNNLKQNKCPKCGKELEFDEIESGTPEPYTQFSCKCGFKISEKRFKEIVSSQVNRDIDKYHEEMEEERKTWD